MTTISLLIMISNIVLWVLYFDFKFIIFDRFYFNKLKERKTNRFIGFEFWVTTRYFDYGGKISSRWLKIQFRRDRYAY